MLVRLHYRSRVNLDAVIYPPIRLVSCLGQFYNISHAQLFLVLSLYVYNFISPT